VTRKVHDPLHQCRKSPIYSIIAFSRQGPAFEPNGPCPKIESPDHTLPIQHRWHVRLTNFSLLASSSASYPESFISRCHGPCLVHTVSGFVLITFFSPLCTRECGYFCGQLSGVANACLAARAPKA